MPVRPVFRCQFCGERPDPPTAGRAREPAAGHVLRRSTWTSGPERWLVWHGRGPLGPKRYACGAHRGELTAYLRFHYASVGLTRCGRWGPTRARTQAAGNARAAHMSRMGGSGFAA